MGKILLTALSAVLGLGIATAEAAEGVEIPSREWSFTPCTSSSFSATPRRIAFRCGSDPPLQITKKSVIVEIPVRSKITISSACLASAKPATASASSFPSIISSVLDREKIAEAIETQNSRLV